MINEFAVGYWKEQELAVAVIEKLCQGPHQFGDATAWQVHLQEIGITSERHVRIASEGALLGSLIDHGVSAELGVLSDGAGQFDVLVHIACWIHAERPLTRMVPYSDEHRAAIEKVRQSIWELYQDLKAYRLEPEAARQPLLERVSTRSARTGQASLGACPSIRSCFRIVPWFSLGLCLLASAQPSARTIPRQLAPAPLERRQIFRRLCVKQISCHSADTFSSPRNRNVRIPRADLI